MPQYLVQVGYTAEAVGSLVRHPQDRLEAVRPSIERLGGRVIGQWFAFGEYDVVAVVEMPNSVTMAALSMATTAGRAVRAFKTTPLLSAEESVQAMQKAGSAGYRPPE